MLMDDDESKAKSEQRTEVLAAKEDNTATDYNPENRYFLDDRSATFGWATTMLQQNIHRHDPFRNDDSMPKSETSSNVDGGGLLRIAAETTSFSTANMRLVLEQASTCNYNPSVSSSSSDQDLLEKSIGSDDQTPSPSTVQISSKKKGQMRIRQQRFAFVTKSEVDHLEDGYRWRKYGQKAVKNSPYPRSYYRCTNTKCTVKKRVERSCEDTTTVITTYEGQHCHQTAGFPRGGGLSIREAACGVQMGPLNSHFYFSAMHLPQPNRHHGSIIGPTPQPTSVPGEARDDSRMIMSTEPPLPKAGSTPQFPSDEGLLGDIVSPRLRNNFHP